jgi:nitrogen fixation NifU-like protein
MDEPNLSSLYQQLILEHYKSPRNRGEIENSQAEIHMRNPTCGDEITLQLRVEDGRIVQVAHTGQGCSISQASVSMMSQILTGAAVEEAAELAGRFTAMMHGDEEAARDRRMGDLRALAGVARFPVRVKCALLGFDALQEALKQVGDPPTEA